MTDDAVIAHYQAVLEEEIFDLESYSLLVVTGARLDEVAAALEVDVAASPTEWPESDDASGYALAELPGAAGVLALELSGYGDPSRSVLRRLTAGGRAAAVVRDNIQAHHRFGAARDGEIVVDVDSINLMDADDRDDLPELLRPLFDRAWGDPGYELDDTDVDLEAAITWAMGEAVTGVRLTADDLRRVREAGFRPAPILRYAEDLDDA